VTAVTGIRETFAALQLQFRVLSNKPAQRFGRSREI
jgi:hypothetical protein